MKNVNIQETVTPECRVGNLYSLFGHLRRTIEINYPDDPSDEFYPDFEEVLTKHCGWVYDDINPSFDCKQCSEGCIEYEKWEEFFSSL